MVSDFFNIYVVLVFYIPRYCVLIKKMFYQLAFKLKAESLKKK